MEIYATVHCSNFPFRPTFENGYCINCAQIDLSSPVSTVKAGLLSPGLSVVTVRDILYNTVLCLHCTLGKHLACF